MKEFSGGVPAVGFEESKYGSLPTGIVDPVYPHDPLRDAMIDHCLAGGNPRDLLESLEIENRWQWGCRLVMKMLALFRTSNKTKRLVDELDWICGASLNYDDAYDLTEKELAERKEKLLGKYARRYGLSKQAFEQSCEKLRGELNLTRSQSRRDNSARAKMSMRTTRRTKGKFLDGRDEILQ